MTGSLATALIFVRTEFPAQGAVIILRVTAKIVQVMLLHPYWEPLSVRCEERRRVDVKLRYT